MERAISPFSARRSILIAIALGLPIFSGCNRDRSAGPVAASPPTEASVDLSPSQLGAIKIGTVESRAFAIEKEGIGTIDFDNKLYFDTALSTPVPPPRSGKIGRTFVELGDEVQKDQPLYSITPNEISPGENPEPIVVRSPISGQITAINAPAGLFVQPTAPPAPCMVADVSLKWMLANVNESDIPFFRAGEPVRVRVAAFPDRAFEGKVTRVYATLDPATHRIPIRCEVADPENMLRSGMFATFSAQVSAPIDSIAIPTSGIVHEGDGTTTAWITADRRHFERKTVTIGLQKDGQDQVLSGLQAGDLAVTEGAVFLSNMLEAPPAD